MLTPFPVLLKSKIQKRKKVVLLGLFGLGLFITIIQIIRIQTVKKLANYLDSAPLILWSEVENNLGIIVANIPTLAPLVKYFNERSRGGGTGSNQRKPGSGYPSRGVGSRYAMQTWGTGRPRGLEELDSDAASMDGAAVSKGNSTEYILETSNGPADGGPAGITKKTEVTVTRD